MASLPLALASLLVLMVAAATLPSTFAVEFLVANNALDSPGGIRFNNEIGADFAQRTMDLATNFIWIQFQQSADPTTRKQFTQVFLYVDDFQGSNDIAYTYLNGIDLRASYLADYQGDLPSEFNGVMYHELARVWQWNGAGKAPLGLLTGIADFVRLRSGYIPTNWVLPGQGNSWDQGYDVTARFLDYCDHVKNGVVAELNQLMKDGYNENFFEALLGKSVNQVWSDYKLQSGN